MKPTRLTPAQAIRKHCLECSAFQPGEIDKCTVIDCALWPWRFGHGPDSPRTSDRTNPYEFSGKAYTYPDGGPGKYKEIEKPLWWELPLREITKRFGLGSGGTD